MDKTDREQANQDMVECVEWARSVAPGYVKSNIFFSLTEAGVFDILRDRGGLTANEIAKVLKLDQGILCGILDYTAFSDDLIIKKKNKYLLTTTGEKFIYSDIWRAFSYSCIGGYASIFYNLLPALRGEKQYGVDFERRGDFLAIGSYIWGKETYPWVVKKCSELGVKNLVDLGCGSADVLLDFCQLSDSLTATGIDISSAAIQEANIRIKHKGLENRIDLIEADLTKPDQYSNQIRGVQAFHALMVLHEFLKNGEDYLIAFLKSMKSRYPGCYFFIGEFNSLTDEEYTQLRKEDRYRFLLYQHVIHPLSLQGSPMKKSGWISLFEKSGLQVIEEQDHPTTRLTTFITRM